jgi:colanic acid biosynthesis glycosyl transferase WcaI
MHILFLTDNFPPELNANATIVHELATYWVQMGHHVTVITGAPNFPEGKLFNNYKNKWYQKEIIDGIQVIRVKTFIYPNKGTLLRIVDFLSFMISSFFAGLFQAKPDAIIAISPQFFTTVSGLSLAKIKRCKFLFMLCDLWPASIEAVGAINNKTILKWVEKLELFIYRHSDNIISLTHAFKQDLIARHISASKIEVIINGVDTKKLFPIPPAEFLLDKYGLQHKFVVSYIGTFGMAHALTNVIEAAKLLKDKSDIMFLLVGSGADKAKLIQLKQEYQLSNVIIEGLQPKALIPSYWSITDLALIHLRDHPLFTTVIPSKMFEAFAMEKPVIYAGPIGEASQFINEHKVGTCIAAENPQALAKTILSLKGNPLILSELANHTFAVARQYNREDQAIQILKLCNNKLDSDK